MITQSRVTLKKPTEPPPKKHHPDRFTTREEKQKQELMMVRITEAYGMLMSYVVNKKKEKPDTQQGDRTKLEKETDYALSRKCVDAYNTYFGVFVQLFAKRALKTVDEKENCLLRARGYFTQLLNKYPKSDWVQDSREKLQKIEKAKDYSMVRGAWPFFIRALF